MRGAGRNNRRGSMMLSMAAITLILVMICGTILLRSVDAYYASARGERSLAARAAAEGAVVTWMSGIAPAQVEIGEWKVTPDTAAATTEFTTTSTLIPFSTALVLSENREVFKLRYVAELTSGTQPGLIRLERVP